MNEYNFIFKYLSDLNIEIDEKEFIFQLESHPNFPSLFSYSETLSFFSINNIVIDLSIEDINLLPNRFLCLVENNEEKLFTYFKKIDKFHYLINNKFIKITEQELLSKWKNVVLLIDPDTEPKDVKGKGFGVLNKILILPILLLIVAINLSNNFSLILIFIQLLAIIGLYFTTESFKQKNDLNSTLSSNFCNAISKNENCSTLLKLEYKSLINFSDLSILFFTFQILGGIITILDVSHLNFILFIKVGLLISSVFVLFSIYFQIKTQNWCPICLSIISILIIEALLVFGTNNVSIFQIKINVFSILYIAILFLILVGWLRLKKIILHNKKINKEKKDLLKFKRTYSLFINSLFSNDKLLTVKGYNVLSIDSNSEDITLNLKLILNPFCIHCSEAYFTTLNVLSKYKHSTSLDIIFNFIPEQINENMRYLHFKLVDIYLINGQLEFINAMNYWFQSKDVSIWKNKYGENIISNHNIIEEILLTQSDSNTQNKIIFTPSLFINNYKLPNIYKINDIQYFMTELLDDLNKKK